MCLLPSPHVPTRHRRNRLHNLPCQQRHQSRRHVRRQHCHRLPVQHRLLQWIPQRRPNHGELPEVRGWLLYSKPRLDSVLALCGGQLPARHRGVAVQPVPDRGKHVER